MLRAAKSLSHLSLFLVLVGLTGCSASPDEFQPTAQHDHGPWPIEVHSTYMKGFWLSFGPYRTNWVHAPQKKASEVGIQHVNFESKREPRVFELTNAYGGPVYVAGGVRPSEKRFKLGLLDIPLEAGDQVGVIATGGQQIGEYKVRIEKQDKLGFTSKRFETITVGDTVLQVETNNKGKDETIVDKWRGGVAFDFYISGNEKVATLKLEPDQQMWISDSLPPNVQFAIAARSAQLASTHILFKQEQQANDLALAAQLAAP